MNTTTASDTFAAARAAIVVRCFERQPYLDFPETPPFTSAADFTDWCMDGSVRKETQAAISDLGLEDPLFDLLRSVVAAIDAEAEERGMDWLNHGLIA